MFDAHTIKAWTRVHDLLVNRVCMVNEIHGCRYHHGYGNPCVVRSCRHGYVCEYGGTPLCSWSCYDVQSVRDAFATVDALADSLWLVRRAGYLRMLIS